jgi:hypothetical protein
MNDRHDELRRYLEREAELRRAWDDLLSAITTRFFAGRPSGGYWTEEELLQVMRQLTIMVRQSGCSGGSLQAFGKGDFPEPSILPHRGSDPGSRGM